MDKTKARRVRETQQEKIEPNNQISTLVKIHWGQTSTIGISQAGHKIQHELMSLTP